VPSLDAAADTAPALITIDESLNTGQRDPHRMRRSAAAQEGTPGSFSRRLQLAPGLVPPTSWSFPPCGPYDPVARRTGQMSRSWRDLFHVRQICAKSCGHSSLSITASRGPNFFAASIAHPSLQNRKRVNQTCGISIRVSTAKQIAGKSIRRSKSNQPHGQQTACSTGG
jgi:hypothetical protein